LIYARFANYHGIDTIGIRSRETSRKGVPWSRIARLAISVAKCGVDRDSTAQQTATEAQMRPQPLIAVSDVEASSRWYQRLLGCKSDHGGSEYERLTANDELILQLHSFSVEHHHGRIGNPDDKPYGNGVLLWFEIDDFDAALDRAEKLQADVVLPRHRNPPSGDGGPNHWEIWLHDPDGYTVVLASPYGSAGPA
jgi:catechol 2,3-dioxygenase-like lactoylglutathione lyase family enzyme